MSFSYHSRHSMHSSTRVVAASAWSTCLVTAAAEHTCTCISQQYDLQRHVSSRFKQYFQQYTCCFEEVLPFTGCGPDGHHASSGRDTRPLQVFDEVWEQECTRCCGKTLEDVPGCVPTNHTSEQPDIQFAQDEATHIFYVHRFMMSIARYVR